MTIWYIQHYVKKFIPHIQMRKPKEKKHKGQNVAFNMQGNIALASDTHRLGQPNTIFTHTQLHASGIGMVDLLVNKRSN